VSSKAEITESYGQSESDQDEKDFPGAPVARRLFVGKKVFEVSARRCVRIDAEPGALAGCGTRARWITQSEK